MRVLLAGEFPCVREALTDALRVAGWEISHIAAVPSAHRLLASDPVDMVVCDVDADLAACVECCRSLQATRSSRTPYSLAITSRFDDATIAALAEAGVDDIVLLPTTTPVLQARLRLAARRLEEMQGAGALGSRRHFRALRDMVGVQRAFLEELFESAPEGIMLVDESDRVLRVNGEFTRMFGYTQAEAAGRPANDLIAPECRLEEATEITEQVHSGERVHRETVRRRKDGALLDVSLLATPVRADGGQMGVYGIYRDITERRRADEALRRSEARYQALFHQAPVGVFVYDQDFRISECNSSLTRILGVTREQVIGRDVRALHDERVRAFIRSAASDEPVAYIGPYRPRGAPTDLWLSVRSSPLRDDDGAVLGGIVVVQDISDRIVAEKLLRSQADELARINEELRERTDEAEHALRARNRLYATMNHELRTPVSAIMLYNELLLDGVLGPLATEQRDAVRTSQRAAQHLLDLIRDVLDLARLESGRAALRVEPLRLTELIEDVRATMRPLAEQRGSALEISVTGDDDLLLSDPRRLRQVLLNLLANAVKFGRGRPVWLRIELAEEVRMEVVDEGGGIAADKLESIFEEFVQVGDTSEGGSGLGLAISRRIAQLLGGSLQAESRLGVGSTFRLTLPRRPHPAGRAAARTTETASR
jgi:PAS domain S-box-containing protein